MAKLFEYAGRDLESMEGAERYHSHILDVFAPYLGQRVVEVGAGSGAVARLLVEQGVDSVTAIEPSDDMYARLAAEPVTKVHPKHGFLADFANQLKRKRPDSLVYINVFEHVEHDVEEMRRAFDALKPGGHLCIFVPAMPGLYSEFDASIDHYRRYTLKEAKQKATEAGFTVRYARYFDWLGVAPWWLRFKVLKAKRLSPSAVKLYDTVGVPVVKVTESILKPPFGKNVILVAEKPEGHGR